MSFERVEKPHFLHTLSEVRKRPRTEPVTVIRSIVRQCEIPEPGIKHPANFIDKNSDLNPTPPVAAIIRLFGISKRLTLRYTPRLRPSCARYYCKRYTIYLLHSAGAPPAGTTGSLILLEITREKKKRDTTRCIDGTARG